MLLTPESDLNIKLYALARISDNTASGDGGAPFYQYTLPLCKNFKFHKNDCQIPPKTRLSVWDCFVKNDTSSGSVVWREKHHACNRLFFTG